jgi:hypothetical protein
MHTFQGKAGRVKMMAVQVNTCLSTDSHSQLPQQQITAILEVVSQNMQKRINGFSSLCTCSIAGLYQISSE